MTRPDGAKQYKDKKLSNKTRRSETVLGQEAFQQDQTERNIARTRSSPTRSERARQKHSRIRTSPTALRQDCRAWDAATDVKRVGTRSDRSVAESTCSAQHYAGHRPDPYKGRTKSHQSFSPRSTRVVQSGPDREVTHMRHFLVYMFPSVYQGGLALVQ